MNKLYHQLPLTKWEDLFEVIESYEVEKILWYIRKHENKKLPKKFEEDLLEIDIYPQIGKTFPKKKEDIGIKRLLKEVESSEIENIFNKLKILEELGINEMAYLPSNIYTPKLRKENHTTYTIDYNRKIRGKIISSDRKIITDGKRCVYEDFATITNYNYIIYKEINNYMSRETILFAHSILDNFSFDEEILCENFNRYTRVRK